MFNCQGQSILESRIGIFVCMRAHDPENMYRTGPVERRPNISSDSLSTNLSVQDSMSVKAKGNRRLYEAARKFLLEFTRIIRSGRSRTTSVDIDRRPR